MKKTVLILILTFLVGCHSNNGSLNEAKADIVGYANLTYPDSEKIRAAVIQYGQALEETLYHPETGKEIKKNPGKNDRMSAAMECFFQTIPDMKRMSDIHEAARAYVINSKAKARAYVKYNANLSGGVYPSWKTKEWGDPCVYEIHKDPK